jgi:hypothetical protein
MVAAHAPEHVPASVVIEASVGAPASITPPSGGFLAQNIPTVGTLTHRGSIPEHCAGPVHSSLHSD